MKTAQTATLMQIMQKLRQKLRVMLLNSLLPMLKIRHSHTTALTITQLYIGLQSRSVTTAAAGTVEKAVFFGFKRMQPATFTS